MPAKKLTYITLIRDGYKPQATTGSLICPDGKRLIFTLERPSLNNQRDNPATAQNESSCIPEGEYICHKYSSLKFPNTWEITGVKGRDRILFHPANYVSELEGCVATATTIQYMNPHNDPKLDSTKWFFAAQSRDAFATFCAVMADTFTIKITSNDSLCKINLV